MHRLSGTAIFVTLAVIAFSPSGAIASLKASTTATANPVRPAPTPRVAEPTQKEAASAWSFFKNQAYRNYGTLFAAQKAALPERDFRLCISLFDGAFGRPASQRLKVAKYESRRIPDTSSTAKVIALTYAVSTDSAHPAEATTTAYVIKTKTGWSWTMTDLELKICAHIRD